jgi:hypothetical protein
VVADGGTIIAPNIINITIFTHAKIILLSENNQRLFKSKLYSTIWHPVNTG